MPGTFSPSPRVRDPDMHHGTCVTHVPRCIPGSLTSSFFWSRWRGKRSRRMRNPQFYVSGKKSILVIAVPDIILPMVAIVTAQGRMTSSWMTCSVLTIRIPPVWPNAHTVPGASTTAAITRTSVSTAIRTAAHVSITYLSGLRWIFLGAPLKVNGAPGNIQGNLDSFGLAPISQKKNVYELIIQNLLKKITWLHFHSILINQLGHKCAHGTAAQLSASLVRFHAWRDRMKVSWHGNTFHNTCHMWVEPPIAVGFSSQRAGSAQWWSSI